MFKQLNRGISTPIAITIIVILAIVSFGGVFAYQYFATQKANQVTGSSVQKQQATEDWKTYTNTQYGFEFQYPEKYYARIAEPSTTLLFLDETANGRQINRFEINITDLSLYSSEFSYILGLCDADGPNASITCDKITKKETFMNATKFYLNSITTFLPSGQKIQETVGPLYEIKIPNTDNAIFISEAGILTSNPNSQAEQELIQILSTFKFTNLTTTCIDSDGGLNYYVAGQASIPTNGPGHNPQFLEDVCQGNTLTEAYCLNGRIASTTYVCPNGCLIDKREACSQSNTAGWKTYANDEYGFELKYPSDYTVEKNILSSNTANLVFCPKNLAGQQTDGHFGCNLKSGSNITYVDGVIYLFMYSNLNIGNNKEYHYLGSNFVGRYYYFYAPLNKFPEYQIIFDQIISTFKFTK